MPATFTVTPDNVNSPPRVRFDVTIPAGTSGSVLIVRTDPDGRGYPVRLADPAAFVGTAWVGYDYETPYGASVSYAAAVTYLNPGTVTDNLAATTTLSVSDVWLVHPGIPALSMRLDKVTSTGDRLRPVSRGIFEAFGRPDPIIVTDGKRKSVQASLSVRTRTLSELAALIALTADCAVLLLNVPASLGWGLVNEYVSFGDLGEAREVDIGADPYRITSGPYHVVSRPVGGSQSQRTWATVLAESATWQGVLDTRTTWSELLAPTT